MRQHKNIALLERTEGATDQDLAILFGTLRSQSYQNIIRHNGETIKMQVSRGPAK
jgi:hypothetical protein